MEQISWKNRGRVISIEGKVEDGRIVAVNAENRFRLNSIDFPHLRFVLRITDLNSELMKKLRSSRPFYHYAEVITLPPLSYFDEVSEANLEGLRRLIKDEEVVKKIAKGIERVDRSAIRFQTMIEPFLNRAMANVDKHFGGLYKTTKGKRRKRRRFVEESLVVSFKSAFKQLQNRNTPMIAGVTLFLNYGEVFNVLLSFNADALSDELKEVFEKAQIKRFEDLKKKELKNEFAEILFLLGANLADQVYNSMPNNTDCVEKT